MWLYFQPKNYPILKKPVYVIIISSQKSIQSEGTWLGECILRNWIYPILRGHDYVIILSSQKFIPFWGDPTLWLYFIAKILSPSEGTWLCDCILRNEINTNLKGPDYVFIISSQQSISFLGELIMWLYFRAKSLPILRGPDYVVVS